MFKYCKKPFNAATVASRKLEYYKRKDLSKHSIHIVLADLCKQLEGYSRQNDASDGDGAEPDDLEIFQEVLQGDINADGSAETAGYLPEVHPEIDSDTNAIFVMSSSLEDPTSEAFEGAYVDSSAQKNRNR